MKILKGDTVIVRTGKDKGKTSTVVRTLPEKEMVVIDGVHEVMRHQKNRRVRSQGQIVAKHMPVHVSNVSLLENDKPVRVGYLFEGEGEKRKKVRISRASGKKI